MIDLNDLNKEQREAVEYNEGPLLILAGAGSGKTRVLTYKIAYLVESCGVSPREILAITFTNKAAKEMKDRIKNLLGDSAEQIWAKTFHSFCLQILRFEVKYTVYEENFTIYDDSDQITLIKRILNQLNIDEKNVSPREYLSKISSLKANLLIPNEFDEDKLDTVYELYQESLVSNNALDFDDIITCVIKLFQEYPDILDKYQKRFKYILVDEYQDTNFSQYLLLHMLANEEKNICVVGDDDQSIYEWRGADSRNILEFEQDYPNAKLIKLERNYRSTQMILDAANSLIENNINRKGKTLKSVREDGVNLYRYTAVDAVDEANFIARQILRLKTNEHYKFSDFAILSRSAVQFRAIEEALLKSNLPYQVYGGIKFFQRKEIKDLMSYLKFLSNPYDFVSFERAIGIPKRGIGVKTLSKMHEFALSNQINYLELKNYLGHLNISKGIKDKLLSFYELFELADDYVSLGQITLLAEYFYKKSGIEEILVSDDSIESETRIENIGEFLSITREFDKNNNLEKSALSIFLEEISLFTDLENNFQDSEESISLMTLHSSKGLEFKVVFISGMEENLFPHYLALSEDIEGERRLCYVGITRAMDKLFLTHATSRFLHGRHQHNPPSRFFNEITPLVIKNLNEQHLEAKEIRYKTQEDETKDYYNLGDKIIHSTWGEGVIVAKDLSHTDEIIKVAFPDLGVKTLILKFAPIKKVAK